MIGYTLLALAIAVALYLLLGDRRSAAFVRAVANEVAERLREAGEQEYEIAAYLHSKAFAVEWKSSFGKRSADETILRALADYQANVDSWRRAGLALKERLVCAENIVACDHKSSWKSLVKTTNTFVVAVCGGWLRRKAPQT
jgi:hypothetical protein